MSDTSPVFKKLRFVVGDVGKPYSARWSVWAHKCNVYLLSVPIGHAVKVSLHGDDGSLVCQVANTEHYYATHIAGLPDAEDRSIVRWNRKSTPDRGLLRVASIQFPTDYLIGKPITGTPKKPLIAFPPGEAGTMVEIGVFYSRLPPDEAETLLGAVSTPIAYYSLPNGDNVSIAGRIRKYKPLNLPSGDKLTGGVPIPIRTRHWTEDQKKEAIRASESGTASMIAFNDPADGDELIIVEMGGLKLTLSENSTKHSAEGGEKSSEP